MHGRERLLEAAHGLFGTRPYAIVGVAEILSRAGVQAPTLYHHFQDKEGLYCAWVEQAFTQVAPSLSADVALDVDRALTLYAEAMITTVGFDVAQVLRDTGQMVRDETRERIYDAYLQAVFEPLCGILIRGMQRGALVSDPVARLAEIFLSGLATLRTASPRTSDGGAELAAWWVARFLNGVSVARGR